MRVCVCVCARARVGGRLVAVAGVWSSLLC